MEKILIYLSIILSIVSLPVYAEMDFLRIPLQTDYISLDPSHIQDTSSLFVSRQINCQLVRNQGSIYKLEAAKSIEYISPLEIRIKINDDITFYDGTPVTANDVVASFNYIKKTRNILRNMFAWVNEIVIVDDKTIIFKLKKSIPQFIKVLASPHNAIFNKEFLRLAESNNKLWNNPKSCGGYKVLKYDENKISLIPVKKGMGIYFFLNKVNQLPADSIDRYDIISLNITGDTNKFNKFNKIEIFDPYQIFIGINAKNPTWADRNARCSFLSKINTAELLTAYGDSGKMANDFFPAGMLGYSKEENYFSTIKSKYKDSNVPLVNNFCLAYLTVSIPQNYLSYYVNMLKKIYPRITMTPINDNRQFGRKFSELKCDALLFGLKSNNLDGYEYLDIFANKDANFSGIFNGELVNKIKSSQDIVDAYARVHEYRDLVKYVESMCIIRPLVTTPMRIIYIHKSLSAPDIGLGSLNDYYLGNVKRL